MPMRPADPVVEALRATGLLLKQDRTLPSVVGILTGESLRSSWWSHPKGRLIFAVLAELDDRPDVLFTKLLGGKVTLVHRRLWAPLATVGLAREPWQLARLSRAGRALLTRVDGGPPVRASGPAVRELETRLLVVARQVHTESGRHETALQGWREWAAQARIRRGRSPAAAKRALELAASRLGASPDALPWKRD
jgi:hypothetical protein